MGGKFFLLAVLLFRAGLGRLFWGRGVFLVFVSMVCHLLETLGLALAGE